MSGTVYTIGPDDSVEAALGTMRKNKVRRVPVVESGRLVGILSLRDLTSALPSWQLGGGPHETAAEALVETFVVISEPRNGVRIADPRRSREAGSRA
jgi:CBS domain-containing protein